jgi:hypothetical protein
LSDVAAYRLAHLFWISDNVKDVVHYLEGQPQVVGVLVQRLHGCFVSVCQQRAHAGRRGKEAGRLARNDLLIRLAVHLPGLGGRGL